MLGLDFDSLPPAWQLADPLFLYTDDANRAPREYQEFWYDRPQQIAEHLA